MRNKIFFVAILLVLLSHSFGFSQKYFTKQGELIFEASVPSFEEVKAMNKGVSAILNTENGEVAALALIRGFRFKIALMEEHFNENYIESQKYPKATFKGVLDGFSFDNVLAKGKLELPLSGILTIRGHSKEIETMVLLKKVGAEIRLTTSFDVAPSDFDIDIPKIVRNKIADTVAISLDFKLEQR